MRGRTPPLRLTAHERESLMAWSRDPEQHGTRALRATIILECATGSANCEVARKLDIHRETVGKWRSRYLRSGISGLDDEPRPGAPRRITDGDIRRVVAITLDEDPPDAMRWSTRSMAARSGLSPSTIGRIWRRFDLHPQRGQVVTGEHRARIFHELSEPQGLAETAAKINADSIREVARRADHRAPEPTRAIAASQRPS